MKEGAKVDELGTLLLESLRNGRVPLLMPLTGVRLTGIDEDDWFRVCGGGVATAGRGEEGGNIDDLGLPATATLALAAPLGAVEGETARANGLLRR